MFPTLLLVLELEGLFVVDRGQAREEECHVVLLGGRNHTELRRLNSARIVWREYPESSSETLGSLFGKSSRGTKLLDSSDRGRAQTQRIWGQDRLLKAAGVQGGVLVSQGLRGGGGGGKQVRGVRRLGVVLLCQVDADGRV